MRSAKGVLLCSVLICYSMLGQLQFQEMSNALGCPGYHGTSQFGGGISFFDFDNDGWDDITLSTQQGVPLRFFKNNQGTFSNLNLNLGYTESTKTVIWVDFDNDGDNDLYATGGAPGSVNVLYENNGSMQFTDITNAAGLNTTDNRTHGASWGDINNDGYLDLFISSRNASTPNVRSILYKNNGNGTFSDITVSAGLTTDNTLAFCSAFIDYNKDGLQDIYISNDKDYQRNIMYRNNGDETFTDVTAATGTDVLIDAMSTTIGDPDKNGYMDIYITNSIPGNKYLLNNGDNTFTDHANTNGTLMESFAWGAVFLDAENDGDLDLYVSAMFDNNNLYLSSAFYENDGTGNHTIPQGIGFEQDLGISFSNALGDVDNDGYPEIVVMNNDPDHLYLWKNQSNQSNNWLKVKLEGVQSNKMGVGSLIEISVNGNKQYNYTLCGEGYLGQNSSYEFFGIGSATSIDYIKVSWLSGIVDLLEDPDINSHLVLTEGSHILSSSDYRAADLNLSVYPNPSSGIFIVELDSLEPNTELKIFDMQGREIIEQSLNSKESTINLSMYSKGVYLMQVISDSYTITRQIILK